MHVMEHCIDNMRALENTAALLKENGLVEIEVPYNACAESPWFGDTWYWLDMSRHLSFFTIRSLEKLVEDTGFKIEDLFFQDYF